MKITTISFIVLLLASCSSIQISPEGEQVNVAINTDTTTLDNQCKMLGSVAGFGSSKEEAQYDLRHNAKINYNANTVVITTLELFYQTERMTNYHRRPTLVLSRASFEYTYKDAFTLQALGMAYLCQTDFSTQ